MPKRLECFQRVSLHSNLCSQLTTAHQNVDLHWRERKHDKTSLSVRFTQLITRINVGYAHFCKPQICCNFTFLQVQLFNFYVDKTMLMVWLGLGTRKDLVRIRKRSWFGLKYFFFCHHKCIWKLLEITLKAHSDLLLTNIETLRSNSNIIQVINM